MISPSRRLMTPPKVATKSIAETPMPIGMSRLTLFFVRFIGDKSAQSPTMTRVLKLFDPTTFPIAISGFPLTAETKLTTISGRDVPRATIVRPMTNSDM